MSDGEIRSHSPLGVRCLKAPRETHGRRPLTVVSGALPRDLDGRLYRVGPGRFEQNGVAFGHWFDGEGLVLMVDFADGAAHATLRFVEDRSSADYADLGRLGVAPRRFWDRFKGIWTHKGYVNLANTALLYWGDRLFALYEAAPPLEIDPDTLDVIGETDLGVVRRAFSAHPKFHRPSGAWINQGFRFFPSPKLDYYALGADGKARVLGAADYNGGVLTHDFAVTDRRIISVSPPVEPDSLGVLFRGLPLAKASVWRGEKPTEFIVADIESGETVRRFEVDAAFYSHTANAYDDGDVVVVQGVSAPDGGGLEWVGAIKADAARLPVAAPERLTEFRLNLATGEATRRTILDATVNFPTLNPDYAGASARFAYAVGFFDETHIYEDFFDAVVKIDLKTGAAAKARFGPASFVSEPIFAPRVGGDGETDGYALTIVYDADADDSFLAVVDADTFQEVARVALGQPLPMSFHGLFRRRSALV